MASEVARGCGYRKVGGLYLVGGIPNANCCKMPILLHVCPTCGGGIRQSRAWTWIDPKPWLKELCSRRSIGAVTGCPLSFPDMLGERVGLIWVGEQFYPTPDHFNAEARMLGISRRIKAVPRGFRLGEDWVFLAHPKVKRSVDMAEDGSADLKWLPGVINVFKPIRIEKIVTESDYEDEAAMAELVKRGITPVAVRDRDTDHQGEDDEERLPL